MKERVFAILALHAKMHGHLDRIETVLPASKVEVKTEAKPTPAVQIMKPMLPKPEMPLESLKKEVLAIHFV